MSRGGEGSGSQSSDTVLDAERIAHLFKRLDHRLRSRGLSANLYVIGGAALAMEIGKGRATLDVDVARLDPEVAAEADRIGLEEGLPPGWLNSAAGPWVPSAGPTSASLRPGLVVEYAPKEHLLAMKIVAQRRRDVEDISALADSLGMTGAPPAEFERLLRSVYCGEGELAQVIGGPEDAVDDEIRHLAEVASRIAAEPSDGVGVRA